MKKSLILVMLFLAGAVSMTAQDVTMGHSTVAVVEGKIVNVGTITATGAVDVRKKAEAAEGGAIINEGTIHTNGLIVGAETSVNNKGFLCVDCEPGTLPPSVCQITLTVNAGTGGFVSSPGGVYECGASVSLTATPEENYDFDGWYVNGTHISSTPSYNFTMPNEDYIIEARFEAATGFLLTFSGLPATITVNGSPYTYERRFPAGVPVMIRIEFPENAKCPHWQDGKQFCWIESTEYSWVPEYDFCVCEIVYDIYVDDDPDNPQPCPICLPKDM